MAIHPLLPGIEVSVCVNGQALLEYDDDESQPDVITSPSGHQIKTITKYIESAADQEFSLRYTVRGTYKLDSPSLGFKAVIDNLKVGISFRGRQHGRSHSWSGGNSGVRERDSKTGEWLRSPFKFAAIETSLDEDMLARVSEDAKTMQKTGCIVVEVFRETRGVLKDWPQWLMRPTLDTTNKVHEKALKGDPKYHTASLGSAQPCNVPKQYRKGEKIDGKDSPILRFIFKYRSKEALKQLLIIERTPGPEESIPPCNLSALDLENLDNEQRRQVETFVRNLKQGRSSSQDTKLKRERNDDEGTLHDKKRPRNSGEKVEIELIDLTDD